MERARIVPSELNIRPHHLWSEKWLLLASGDFQAGRYNAMTVGWGSIGTMWMMPFVQVVVRPGRYTFQLLEESDSFTLCAFPDTCRQALQIMGSKSGRDMDKIAAAGLTPVASTEVAAPGFDEAELIIECRKIYWQDLNPQHFLAPYIKDNYPKQDYHRIYFGSIAAVWGTPAYHV